MKKFFLLILLCIVVTGCNSKKIQSDQIDKYEVLDQKFTENNISFIREAKLEEDNYYALEGWQYVINNSNCIVDVYRYDESSNIYSDFVYRGAIKSKSYDDSYIEATLNYGLAAMIWDGCNNKEQIIDIITDLE